MNIEKAKCLIKKLAKIDSQSGREKELSEFLVSYLKRLGYSPKIDEVGNVVVDFKKDLWVTAHLDTVERVSDFREMGNLCFGTGVADDKASIAAILLALEKAAFNCVFFVDEEETGIGSQHFAEVRKPSKAIVMEPTELKICSKHWGVFEFQVDVVGEKSHASMPKKNAIELAIELINKLKVKGKLNLLGIWSKPENIYVTPYLCTVKMEYLISSGFVSKLIFETLEIAEKYGKVKILEVADPFESILVHKILEKAVILAGIEPETGYMPSWTDAVNLNKKGWDTVVFGPGNLENCHTEREYVDVRDVVLASRVLENLRKIYNV